MTLESRSHDLLPSFPQHQILPSVLSRFNQFHFSTIRHYIAHILSYIASSVLHHSDNGSLCSTSMLFQISFTSAPFSPTSRRLPLYPPVIQTFSLLHCHTPALQQQTHPELSPSSHSTALLATSRCQKIRLLPSRHAPSCWALWYRVCRD